MSYRVNIYYDPDTKLWGVEMVDGPDAGLDIRAVGYGETPEAALKEAQLSADWKRE